MVGGHGGQEMLGGNRESRRDGWWGGVLPIPRKNRGGELSYPAEPPKAPPEHPEVQESPRGGRGQGGIGCPGEWERLVRRGVQQGWGGGPIHMENNLGSPITL